ncbi:DUF981 family protein [Actinomadura oligospora]|uniref:DUF981 family protein n=1 Tax=Actinomadura oligospora TaxID=111804 RepID=UPI00047B8A09|nr:DUF981 family protein [Actinomadura oligospora]
MNDLAWMAAAGPELRIDWARMPTYNTIMAVAAGAGLLLVVGLARRLLSPHRVEPAGWALAFTALGLVLTLTGLHMTLTWPLAGQGFPFDNVIFGEPSLAFGVMLLVAALFLWKRGEAVNEAPDRPELVARLAGPLSIFVFGMGLACFGIAAAGWKYQLFAAPPQEPISGQFADQKWLEATFISGLYVLVGIGAVLFPFALRTPSGWIVKVIGVVWTVAGVLFLLFGALNYFTHIGLIINTS